jgi:N-methylhydantoinase A/oxoprolinase/acetone carboxylase beta subunit
MADTRPRIAIGVDIGGTFTDIVLIEDGTGRAFSAKILTTPEHPAAAVLDGVEAVLAQAGSGHAATRTIVHGTTLATNAIIERKGARTALLTTRGFRDALETARELRYDLYDLFIRFPAPLVPRRHRIGITERTGYDGDVLVALDEADVSRAVAQLVRDGIESIAVCFLHSYANAGNEQAAAAVIRATHPDLAVSLSSRVLPEIGEYARASTTAANAYVQPLVARYLTELVDALRARGGLERRHAQRGRRARAAGAPRRVGPGGRRVRRDVLRGAHETAGRARVRHGRHHREDLADHRRADDPDDRAGSRAGRAVPER